MSVYGPIHRPGATGGHASRVGLLRNPETSGWLAMIGHIVSSFHAVLHLGWEHVWVCGILSRPRPALDLLFTSTGMMMGWLLLADLMPFSVWLILGSTPLVSHNQKGSAAQCILTRDQRIQHTLRDTHPEFPGLCREEWDPRSLTEPLERLCNRPARALSLCHLRPFTSTLCIARAMLPP